MHKSSQHSPSFGRIIRKREAHQIDTWMRQVQESSFRHIKRFVTGLQWDKEEVIVPRICGGVKS